MGRLLGMKRVSSRELLDDDAGTPSEIAGALADIGFVNRYFGGVANTKRMIERVARGTGQSAFSILDVASGTGETPQIVRALIEPSGIHLQLTLLDRRGTHMRDGERKVVADALALPFRDNSFDLISCCLFVHHLGPDEVVRFAKDALRCCRLALLINDLVREPVHLATAYASRLVCRSWLAWHDGIASVRQSYTPDEMRGLLEQSGAGRVEISRHWLFRMAAIAWKDAHVS